MAQPKRRTEIAPDATIYFFRRKRESWKNSR